VGGGDSFGDAPEVPPVQLTGHRRTRYRHLAVGPHVLVNATRTTFVCGCSRAELSTSRSQRSRRSNASKVMAPTRPASPAASRRWSGRSGTPDNAVRRVGIPHYPQRIPQPWRAISPPSCGRPRGVDLAPGPTDPGSPRARQRKPAVSPSAGRGGRGEQLAGCGRTVAMQHRPRLPAGEPHQGVVIASAGPPHVGERVAEDVRVQPVYAGLGSRRSSIFRIPESVMPPFSASHRFGSFAFGCLARSRRYRSPASFCVPPGQMPFCAPSGTRTPNRLIKSQLLCQLS
jgi:hypothetical protein